MIPLITEAAENFFHNQIELQTNRADTLTKMRTVIASIEIEMDDGVIKTVYLGFNEDLIKEIIYIYLGEESADEQSMRDMALESTNMIVGSAKVLAEKEDKNHFMITTPKFEKIEEFDSSQYSEISILQTSKEGLVIGIKE